MFLFFKNFFSFVNQTKASIYCHDPGLHPILQNSRKELFLLEIDYEAVCGYERMSEYLRTIPERFPETESGFIGSSILGRDILYLRIGHGKSASLLVGAHHGMEHITSLLLVKFLEDSLNAECTGKRIAGGFDVRYILAHRRVYVIPMLNPDGVEIETRGADTAGPLRDRLVSMNSGNLNFSSWQANARGVDLNHNYDAGFAECRKLEREHGIYSGGPTRYGGEYPESEPETSALCRFTRFLCPNLRCAVALHTQGEEIYWDYLGKAPKDSRMLAECFANVSGYQVSAPDGIASYGGYKDWVISELNIPAFTIECGYGKNPLPPSDFYKIYEKVLPILLTAAAF
ncbi:MAG: peptidase M14 [Clostridiales bacterium]|nr:MAG: peptidase M14 [Clostridiales bacterium]